MKVGLIGAGNIGGTLARKLVTAGREGKLEGSRGPEALRDRAREVGAVPVASEEVVPAIPVAGDHPRSKAGAMALVDAVGLDALDLAGSWRQQPGTPACCTELTLEELRDASAAADKARAPENRC
ncbi:MAG: NAD(P)-binding domain-containing protein [Myxococcota bacterium]